MLKRLWDKLTGRAWARRAAEEFARDFPGRCMICSYHRYGFQNNHTDAPRPEPHDCIEGNV
jgi:hypothetical protein